MIPALVNDAAGTAAQARAALEESGEFDVRDVPPKEMEEVLRQELAAHPHRILVAGGDGTIGTAAALLQGTDTELAIFPGGTLNHFARDHGIPTDPSEAAACGCGGRTLKADVAFANDHLFLNTSSVGAYVTYVRLRERIEKYVGYRVASVIAGVRLIFRIRPIRITLEIEGERHEYDTPLVFIGVGERELKAPSFGSRIPDGEHCLHVLVVRERRATRLLVVALEAMRRGLESVARTPELDAYKVDACSIALRGRRQHVALDGELVQVTSPVKYELHRGALTVVVPRAKDEEPTIAVAGPEGGTARRDDRRERRMSDVAPITSDAHDASVTAQLADRLREIVGDRFVLERASELLAYESDGLPGYHRRPRLAVFPGTRDETIAVVRTLAESNAAFVARGAGTGLSGGALADDVVLLGVHRLKRVIDLDVAHLRATVEPGVVNAALNRRLAAHGVFYAPDPSSETACTIGGNLAENAGGPHCLKYGVTLNHVLAATVILPDGEIVQLGDPGGDMRGYDLLGAFIGSEGCFGVVLDATVRLTRRPESVRTALADFMSVDAAARATSAIIASGVLPAALEFMDHAAIRVVEESVYAAGYPADAAAVLLIEVDGTRESVEHDLERVRALCEESGARTVRVARDDAERAKLWQGRKKAFGAMGRMAPHLVVQDAVIPRTKLPEVLAAIHGIGDAHGVVVCNVFHAGDGNLHPNIAYDADDPEEAERVHTAMSAIMHACIDAGGSITGEHGVGLDKLGYMPDLFDAPTLAAMCDLRGVFDTDRRANPGKVVPVRSCREWHATPAGRDGSHGHG